MNNLEKQFSQIYDQYIDKIYRFVFVKVDSQEIAQDITSKVFTSFWQAFGQGGQKIDNVNAFLYRVARNAVTDHYRENARARFVSTDLLPNLADTANNPIKKAEMDADLLAIRAQLANLNEDYQNAIIWHYIDGLSVPEVAQLMGKSEANTRVLLHRALDSLKKRITS